MTDFDAVVRREAQRWLTVRTNDGQTPISSAELLDFEIDGAGTSPLSGAG